MRILITDIGRHKNGNDEVVEYTVAYSKIPNQAVIQYDKNGEQYFYHSGKKYFIKGLLK